MGVINFLLKKLVLIYAFTYKDKGARKNHIVFSLLSSDANNQERGTAKRHGRGEGENRSHADNRLVSNLA